MTSRLGTGKPITLFYSVLYCIEKYKKHVHLRMMGPRELTFPPLEMTSEYTEPTRKCFFSTLSQRWNVLLQFHLNSFDHDIVDCLVDEY
jgi:hypothetical protein